MKRIDKLKEYLEIETRHKSNAERGGYLSELPEYDFAIAHLQKLIAKIEEKKKAKEVK